MKACGMVWAAAVMTASGVLPAWAQNAGKQLEPAKTLLVVDRAALSDLMRDAKDKKFDVALGMLSSRLRELPDEIPDMPPQVADVLDLILNAVARPAKVAISYGAGNPAHGLWGYGITVSVEAKDAGDAKEMHASVNALLAQSDLPKQFAPKESERIKGMADMPLPMGFGLMSYGPRESASGWRYEVIIGSLDNPDAAFAAIPQPMGGAEPVLRGRLDLEQLTPAAQFIMTMAGGKDPEIRELFKQVTEMGLIGPNALKIDFEDGYTKTAHLGRVVVRGLKAHREAYTMSDAKLTKAELAMVPLNATMASISKTNWAKMKETLDQAIEQSPELADGLQKFEDETGVDLREDILDSLGETVALYTSDATGGGSIASAVAVMGLKDRAKFLAAHDKLLAKGNDLLSQVPKARGYVKITPWEEGGIRLHSVRFGGIPVPVEITYGVVGDYVLASLTPQGALAAARQMSGKGDAGLGSHEQFAAAIGGREVSGVSYIDTSWMMHAGYPFVSMVGSAVSNGVRARDGSREPGMIVPTYAELAAGARPSVQVMMWNGDDYLIESHGDKSVLVRGAGAAGTLVQFWPIIAAAVGAATGAQHHQEFGRANGWFEPVWAMVAPPSMPVAMRGATGLWPGVDQRRVEGWIEGRWVEEAVEFVK